MITHTRNRVAANFGVVREAKPHAVQAIANLIIVDAIAGAEPQFDRVVINAGNRVPSNRIVTPARQRVRFDEHAIAIAPNDLIVRHRDSVGTILHDDAARIATPTNRACAPGTLAHIVGGSIARHVAILRPQYIDAPRRILRRRISAHRNSTRITHIDTNRLIQRSVIQDLGIGRVVEMHSTTVGRPQELAEFRRGVNIIVVIVAGIIANHQMIACLDVNTVEEIGHLTIANFDVGRGLRVEQTIFANRYAVPGKIRTANRVIETIENDIARLDANTFAVCAHIVHQAIVTG